MGGYSHSYDFILRGEEICSGAIRENDYNKLVQNAKRCEIDVNTLTGYLESFKFGVPVHGGVGIGLERLAKSIFDWHDIRYFNMFPRDPSNLNDSKKPVNVL